MSRSIWVAALVLTCFFSSCRMNVLKGEGPKGSTTLPTSSFNALDIDVSLDVVVNVRSGSTPSVKLEGYENLIKHIKAEVSGNKLRLYSDLDETWTMETEGISVEVTLPVLTSVSLSGSANADIHGDIVANEFKLDISGSSDVIIDNIHVDHFLMDASGAADVEIKAGNAKHAEYDINGAGDISAFGLQTEETTATISGAGESEVTALQKLTASVSGAGSIKYKGHPAVTKEISGAGSVSEAN